MHKRLTRLLVLCASAVSLLPAVVASGQSTPAALSPALRTHLQSERFDIITSIRGFPLGVRDRLMPMFGGTLDIAEPGADFQKAGAAANRQLPSRRMIAAGCSNDFHCLVYYERGGGASTWHVMLFRWTPNETQFEWGGSAPGGFKTVEDVRKALLSGTIKTHTGPW